MRDRLIARQTERPRDLPRRAHHNTGRDTHRLSNISDNLNRQLVAETLPVEDKNLKAARSAAPDAPMSLLFLLPIVYNRLMSYGHFVLVCTLLVAESVAAPLPPPQTHPATSQEAVVFEQIHDVVRFENDGSGTRENTTVVRVQSTAGVQE